jgi:dipeptidyl aminopeptidase/acylaminoacyl peptidase
LAGKLKGHLFIVDGTLDDNVPPYLTLRLVEELVKANKDFDLLMLPNERHGYTSTAKTYATRRRWDYFVRYLLGAEPPKEFAMQHGGPSAE